jgi:predicted AlkP superfamily phosphohydrolase/phosphomutase
VSQVGFPVAEVSGFVGTLITSADPALHVNRPSSRVLVLGLDSVPPGLLFERFLPVMPRVRELLGRATYGTLRSTDPPITVPAWATMFSGMDPGTLGLYGFHHRKPGTYSDRYVPTSTSPREPMVWQYLSRLGKRVCIIGMPPGYPPPPVNGAYISDFLTPDTATDYVFPTTLRREIEQLTGRFPFDVTFRTDDRDRIGAELFSITRKRFEVARHLWAKEEWDFFALHEIGPDRIHHTFWKFFDRAHPRYEENAKYESLVVEYYRLLDREIGALLDSVPSGVRVMILSDHGSQAMQGCFCINQWLIQQGHLTLTGPPPPPGTPLEKAGVDWTRTRAWGWGGYYARIFYNVKGREPQGVLLPKQVPEFEQRLTQELRAIKRLDGSPLAVDVLSPRIVYREVRGDPPDLMAYFGGTAWRSAGTVGYDTLFLQENDTGPDDSVHSFDGVYAVTGVSDGKGQRGPEERLIDIGPTILAMMGVEVPPRIQGRPIERFR